MKTIEELSLWLKTETTFLEENQDYAGSWSMIDDTYAAVVLWESGFGEVKRDEFIQRTDDLDYALCAGVKIIDENATIDEWYYLWDREEKILLTESVGINSKEDYKELAKFIISEYAKVKEIVPAKDGSATDEVRDDLTPIEDEPVDKDTDEEPLD